MCVFHVAVPTAATAPFGFATDPALKKYSVKLVFSSANEFVPHVNTVANGSINPLSAKFEKLSYALEVKIEGEGTVSEEIVVTGKSTDYLYGTTVRLTPTAAEGWDFIKWEEDHNGEENPLEIGLNGQDNMRANAFSRFRQGISY